MDCEFVIPRERSELMRSGRVRQYVVQELLPPRQLAEQMQVFESAFRTRGPLVLLEHFDTPYSVLSQFHTVSASFQEQTLETLVKVVSRHSAELPTVLEDPELSPSSRLDHLNTLKMGCYLLIQFIEAFEQQSHKQELARLGPTSKVRKVKGKNGEFDWEWERARSLQVLTQLLQVDIRRLWGLSQPEEEFIRLISSCCCHILENPSIGLAKGKATRQAVAHLLGIMIKRYNQMLGATLNVIQLLQHFEHLSAVLAQSVTTWATEYGLKSIVGEIMREIGAGEGGRESTGARCCALFLTELAERIPEVMAPNISLVLDLLNGESYTLRNAVLSAVGQILTRVLKGPRLDEQARETRDRFLDTLQLHLHDTNAHVRSRSLQVLTSTVQEKALPVKRFHTIVTLASGRLCDKSVIVCKNAIQLLASIVANNPFTWKLSVSDLQSAHQKELLKLKEIRTKLGGQVPGVELEPEEEWIAMLPEIELALSEALEGEEASELEGEGLSTSDTPRTVSLRVQELLKETKYRPAIRLLLEAKERFPESAPFSPEDLSETKSEGDHRDRDALLRIIKACFVDQEDTGPGSPQSPPPGAGDENAEKETPEPSELAKQEVLVQYLKDALTFASKMEDAIEIVSKFLSSKNPSVIQEAIQFFVTISEFGISQALVGMREMLPLVWSKEAGVREAVTEAYRRLYLNRDSSSPQTLVQNLTALIFDSNMDTIKCLEQLVSDFVHQNEIEPAVIQLLWERLTEKVACSPEERRAAVILLGMAARGEPEIVGSNLETLYTVGLGPRVREQADYQLARDTCLTIGKLSQEKKKLLASGPDTFRLPADHQLFTHISDTVTEGFCSHSPHWRPFAECAIALVYQLSENPDRRCQQLLLRCANLLSDRQAAPTDQKPEVTSSQSGEEASGGKGTEEGPDARCTVPTHLLSNLVTLAGHVALQQMLHLERAVGPELLRRRLSQEQQQEAKRKLKGKAKRVSASAIEEELGLAETSAEDTEAELVRNICDTELLDAQQLLSAFVPLIVKVCTNPGRYNDPDLCTACSLALCKLAMVSHDFCEEHVRLMCTMLEKSTLASIRANTMVALGDLSFRYPNLIEPWTPHLYARLRDPSPAVRRTALIVMTHLILKDMVKVKGQISEISILLIDGEEAIATLARCFFNELSNKGNAVYNLLPDIISRLSDPDCGVEEEPFQTIMRQMFSYITKDKQTESLVEKLCQRFRTARLERQHRDLAFCLSLLPPSERGLRKMQENFECFADKLTEEVVYQHLMGIAAKLHRGIKPELKVLVDEFEQRLSRCHGRGLEGGDPGPLPPPPPPPPPTAKSAAKPAAKKPPKVSSQARELVTPQQRKTRQRRPRVCVTFSSDEGSEEEESESEEGVALESETPTVTSPIRRTPRGQRARGRGGCTPGERSGV